MEKLKINQAIIVEGKYDKIKLESIIDGNIIITNGFQIYSDKEKVKLLKFYADNGGIIILTDSDSAGFQIRNHIKSIVSKDKITNVFIPDIFGKEKRKDKPSKEGKLGVEGIDANTLKQAFKKAGVLSDKDTAEKQNDEITRLDFFEIGLMGLGDSKKKRLELLQKLNLPLRLSTTDMITALNNIISRDELFEMFDEATRN